MIEPSKQRAALQAIQAVMWEARLQAHREVPHERLASMMDKAEYLVALMLEERDQTAFFRSHLESLKEHHGCAMALGMFEAQPDP
ncbi:MAG: hypothetical protein AAF533_13165 [Acidobacteriota bacterium]